MKSLNPGQLPDWRVVINRLGVQLRSIFANAGLAGPIPSPVIHQPLLSEKELHQLLHQVQAATWSAHRRARQHQPGEQQSNYVGRGTDFEEARAYMPGDDLRDMEWRATARTGLPHIKVYRQERQSVLHLVVDRGATMRFGTRERLKVTQAARIAMLLAFDALLANENVGVTVLDEHGQTLRPRSGPSAIGVLIEVLNAPAPPMHGSAPLMTTNSLAEIESVAPPGARIVLLSDNRFLKPEHLSLFARLATNRELTVVQILDPVEKELPDTGRTRWFDLVNGSIHDVDAGDPATHQAFLETTNTWQRQLDELTERSGARVHHCDVRDDAWAFVAEKIFRHE